MRKFIITALIAGLLAGAVAPSAIAAKKKKKPTAPTTKVVTFEESGTIVAPALTSAAFGGITTMEFIIANSCATPPTTQGHDGYIVELPMDFRAGGATIEVIGTDTSTAGDLDVYFYDAGCGLMEPYMTEGANPAGDIPPGATWAAVELAVGANSSFTLKATATVPAT